MEVLYFEIYYFSVLPSHHSMNFRSWKTTFVFNLITINHPDFGTSALTVLSDIDIRCLYASEFDRIFQPDISNFLLDGNVRSKRAEFENSLILLKVTERKGAPI